MQDYDNGGSFRPLPTFVVNKTERDEIVLDPVENIRAAIDYIQERYGSVSNIQTQEDDETEA